MRKILLIEPGARYVTRPPIGLIYLAAVLKDKYQVIIKDYSGKRIDREEIENTIKKIDPFIVGVRVLTGPPLTRGLEVSKIAKKLGKIVVWGGAHPTVLPKQTLESEYIDSVIIGEGEDTFQKLIKYYEGKKVKLEGVGIKKDGKIIITPPPKTCVDINALPLPAWELVEDIDRYFPSKNNNILPISPTRGCAFKCGFCHNSNENVKSYLGGYRIADPQRLIDECKLVQSLVKNKIDILDIGDDLHLISKDYTREFCKTLKESGLDVKWTTSTRYHLLDDEIIDMIKDAGCISILLGIESGCPRIQKLNNKIVELNRTIKIAKKIRRSKIFLRNTYILGHPTEVMSELKQTLNFIKKIPADENLIQIYRPIPGTPYFQLSVENKKVKVPKELEGWGTFGVMGNDRNVSNIPDSVLLPIFYKINLIQQTKFLINQQRFFLRNKRYKEFFKSFLNNRFTFKIKEFLNMKVENESA